MRELWIASLCVGWGVGHEYHPRCGRGSGTASYAELVGSLVPYAFETLGRGWLIGPGSGDCSTTVTPTGDTFSIWSFIYSQTASFYLPSTLSEEAAWHVAEANAETTEWIRTFTAGEERNNSEALRLLQKTRCHLDAVQEDVCDGGGGFLCCAASQYATWVRIATLLSEGIVEKYGARCGSSTVNSDARVEALFAQRFGSLVKDAASGILGSSFGEGESRFLDASRTASLSTLAWAYRGICDARNRACPPFNCSSCPPGAEQFVVQSASASTLSLNAGLLCPFRFLAGLWSAASWTYAAVLGQRFLASTSLSSGLALSPPDLIEAIGSSASGSARSVAAWQAASYYTLGGSASLLLVSFLLFRRGLQYGKGRGVKGTGFLTSGLYVLFLIPLINALVLAIRLSALGTTDRSFSSFAPTLLSSTPSDSGVFSTSLLQSGGYHFGDLNTRLLVTPGGVLASLYAQGVAGVYLVLSALAHGLWPRRTAPACCCEVVFETQAQAQERV